MFSGLVEFSAAVLETRPIGDGLKIRVDAGGFAALPDLGASIAVNGCCLTVEAVTDRTIGFHAARETLGLTNLGELEVGSRVNLERSMTFGAELGGHFVTGHVDGTAEIVAIRPSPSETEMRFRLPAAFAAQVIKKGSIAVDGVSLTVTKIEGTEFEVMLIPHTLAVTTLGRRKIGDRVNFETDMFSKLIQHHVRLMQADDEENRRT